MAGRKVEILLVEDEPEQIALTKLLFSGCKVHLHITAVRDGEGAVDYLLKRGAFTEAATPDLVLLDLNLPKKDGREVLREIRNNPDLEKVPVLVLSACATAQDIICSSYRADSYFEKPGSFQLFRALVQEIEKTWLEKLAS